MKSKADWGIEAIGLAAPRSYLDVRDLAMATDVDPDKYTLGLGCDRMAFCDQDESVTTLAADATTRALAHWGGDTANIGLVATGTETAVDMSRPLSAWVAEAAGLKGAFRSYEVKHACYGGTVAVRQALEWLASGAAQPDQVALVVAADVATYTPDGSAEPTQGAGAVAMIIGKPLLASIDLRSYSWSEPAFDFWRPVGDAHPQVDGSLSIACYNRAVDHCFGAMLAQEKASLDDFDALCFHVPFPKMVMKGVTALGKSLDWEAQQSLQFFEAKVSPSMDWNRQIGNAYTASLWLSLASVLHKAVAGDRIAAFSYGSGFGSELLTLTVGTEAASCTELARFDAFLAGRRRLSYQAYTALRDRVKKAA